MGKNAHIGEKVRHMKSSASESMPSQGRSKVEIPGRARQEPFQIEIGVSKSITIQTHKLFMFLIQCIKNLASKPGLLQEVWLISFGRPVVFLKAWMHFQTRETGNKVKMKNGGRKHSDEQPGPL